MAQAFKEVAHLRGNDEKFKENFSRIDWSAHNNDNHIVSKLTEETEKTAKELAETIKKTKYEENKIYLQDGDMTISHSLDHDGNFIFKVENQKENKLMIIDMDMFETLGKDSGIIADAFLAMYFEISHRDHMEELEGEVK